MTLARRCGAQGAAREAACAAVLQDLQSAGIEQVRIAWADLHGTLRGKTLVCGGTAEPVADALQQGIGLVSTVLLKDTSDRTAFPVFEPGALAALPGFAPGNNVLLLPDPSSLKMLPWAPATAWLRAEPWWPDGSPVLADPRRALQRALAALADAGYGLRCGLEVEFHIYRITADPAAADDAAWPGEPPALALVHPGYNLLAENWADRADEPLAIVRRTLLGLGLPLRSVEIELGPSQVEVVFSATDALTAADHMVLLRNGLRQALRRAGYHATFACRPPFANAIASGWHLHQSLVDREGRNAMPRAAPQGAAGDTSDTSDARAVLSDTGSHWLAGLLAHASGMAALCAPTIPAYSRFHGSVMAPQSAVWGRDNRGAMLRVLGQVGQVGQVGDVATRVENRIAEPMANPYLALAAQVWAGLDGLQRRLEPGPATESPYAAGLTPLPGTLAVALDALAADPVMQQGLGATLAQIFQVVKRQELARHAQAEDKAAWERREYLGRY
jgi:glutamine synthetase